MDSDRTLIEERDQARRTFNEMVRRFLKIIDTDGKHLDRRKPGLKDSWRKIFEEKVQEFVCVVDRIDNIEDQIVLFRNSLIIVTPPMLGGFIGGQRYLIRKINVIMKENSEAARIAARAKKNEEMKEIKEFTIDRAKNYLNNNPRFDGTRHALMVQIKPDIDKISVKIRGTTTSETAITKYLEKNDLP